jgi:hypothetical protein
VFIRMMTDEKFRLRREMYVRAVPEGYAPVTGQADPSEANPKAKEPASFDTKSHVDDRQTRCQEDWGDVSDHDCKYCGAKHNGVSMHCLGVSALQCLGLLEDE